MRKVNKPITTKQWKIFYNHLLDTNVLSEDLLEKKLFAYKDSKQFWIKHPDARSYANAQKALEDILYERQLQTEAEYER